MCWTMLVIQCIACSCRAHNLLKLCQCESGRGQYKLQGCEYELNYSYLFLRHDITTEEEVLDSAQIYSPVCVHFVKNKTQVSVFNKKDSCIDQSKLPKTQV